MLTRRHTAGFTVLELIVVITLIGALSAVAVPRIRDAVLRQSVRGARMAVAAQLSQARGSASHRACPSVIHVNVSSGTTWVTSCALTGVGLDTLGGVRRLAEVYGTRLASSMDSIVFLPMGVANAGGWQTIHFKRGDAVDSLRITPLGRAAR